MADYSTFLLTTLCSKYISALYWKYFKNQTYWCHVSLKHLNNNEFEWTKTIRMYNSNRRNLARFFFLNGSFRMNGFLNNVLFHLPSIIFPVCDVCIITTQPYVQESGDWRGNAALTRPLPERKPHPYLQHPVSCQALGWEEAANQTSASK